MQRLCYEPYFVDFALPITEEHWLCAKKDRTEDLTPGTIMGWY